MFGVSGLRIYQLRLAHASAVRMALIYSSWSALWIAAHAAGGAAIGAVLGIVGHFSRVPQRFSPWILGFMLALGGLHQIGLLRLSMPQLHRQVARHWMNWPLEWTALGYGIQLGSAVSTRITNFTTYVALTASFLTFNPSLGAMTMMLFGIFRSLPAVVSGPMAYAPRQSFALAVRVGEWEPRIHRMSGALLLVFAFMLAADKG